MSLKKGMSAATSVTMTTKIERQMRRKGLILKRPIPGSCARSKVHIQ